MRRIKACLAAALVCLTALLTPALAAEDVYFVSVNDRLRPLTADTMPAWVDGTLYVPASVFDENLTESKLGLYCNQSQSNDTVTVYNLRQMLVFDLVQGNSRNQHTGEIFSDRAITRNGRAYLPVEAVCRFFGLTYSYRHTDFGYLIRIKSSSVILDDLSFIDAASSLMSDRLRQYQQSQPPVEQPDGTGGQEGDEPSPVSVRVCLAFVCGSGEAAAEILDQLDAAGGRGLFFFPAQDLAGWDDLVRRVVGSGHCVGLTAQGGSAGETRALLEQGNQALAHIARTAAVTALVPQEQRQELEQEGWVCWDETVSGLAREGESESSCASRVLSSIGTRQRTVYLTLDDTDFSAQVLQRLLRRLGSGAYTILTPLETRL